MGFCSSKEKREGRCRRFLAEHGREYEEGKPALPATTRKDNRSARAARSVSCSPLDSAGGKIGKTAFAGEKVCEVAGKKWKKRGEEGERRGRRMGRKNRRRKVQKNRGDWNRFALGNVLTFGARAEREARLTNKIERMSAFM